ncbi:TniQ family protein [Leisingera sp. M658]|uniref:TniQ family protein n=1 Tax=Leisingera sp. M658 TaxID=2867015 RepID=UPI0021A8D481|nr:TniQ family protein [Leisingera sp. M658]UWQ75811.1 TniQ family protein [Leisingera sp. M658]
MNQHLSLVPELGNREPAFSFASRVAAYNGVSTQDFTADMGLSFTRIIDGATKDLAQLAILCSQSAEAIEAWSPKYLGSRRHRFRGQYMHAKAIRETTVRGCPLCLREDAEGQDLPPDQAMHLRGDWLFRPVTLCLEHLHPLVPLWKASSKTDRYDVATRMAEIAPAIFSGELDEPTREPSDFDKWIGARLRGEKSGIWLDQFSLYPAAHFCELLGRTLWTQKWPKWRKFPPEDAWLVFSAGFQWAYCGEERIRDALGQIQDQVGEPTEGPKKKFGDLYDRLAFDLRSEEYSQFRAILRDHIATTWPLGPGDDLMGEPVLERRVHSVITASREVGMDPRRLRKLLVEAGYVQPREAGDKGKWEVFDAAAAKPFLDGLNSLKSAGEFQTALSIPRYQFELLREDGYFQPFLDGADHKPLWDVRAGRAFIEKLLTGAEPIYVPMHQWSDIPKAGQRLQIRPGAIIQMIETGQLRRIGKHMTKDGYLSLLVTTDEVERLMQRPDAPGISLEKFAQQCGLVRAAAVRLVRRGHTPSTVGLNPKTGAMQRFLSPADIEAFHKRFVTLRGLAVEKGMTWQSLRVRLKENGVLPFSPDGEDYGAIFERSEIDLLLDEA